VKGLRLGRCIHCREMKPVDQTGFLWAHYGRPGITCIGSGARPGVNR
jgi:hypothetical protein